MISSESVMQDLESYIYKELVNDHGEKIALACVDAMFECLYLNFRGQLMYIPTLDRARLTEFYALIFNDFNGRNHKDLSIKYKRSLVNIYNIINLVKERELRKIQSDLFPLDEEKKVKPVTLMVIEDYLPNDLVKAGLSEKYAKSIAIKFADYLCLTYPGISIRISDSLRKKRTNLNQISLF